MEGYLGEIRLFGGSWAPRNWMFCAGQILSYDVYPDLFSILGTTYGGDGQTTFGLPDLRGRVAIGPGQGPGLPNVYLGEIAGSFAATLVVNNLPAHSHGVTVNDDTNGSATSGAGGYLDSKTESGENIAASARPSPVVSKPGTIGITGNNQSFSIMQPYLGLNFIICVVGIYPTRN